MRLFNCGIVAEIFSIQQQQAGAVDIEGLHVVVRFGLCSNKEVVFWAGSQPLHTPLLVGDFLALCERARRLGVARLYVAFTHSTKFELRRNPQYTLLIRAQSKSPSLREGLRS